VNLVMTRQHDILVNNTWNKGLFQSVFSFNILGIRIITPTDHWFEANPLE
jgi:hypothetical protein